MFGVMCVLFLLQKSGLSSETFNASLSLQKQPSILPTSEPTTSPTKCIEPKHSKICSGRGSCVDDKCVCENELRDVDPLYKYSGPFCEECPYCAGQRCRKFLPCIDCKVFVGEGTHCGDCEHKYFVVDNVNRNPDADDKMCEEEDESGCYIVFKYVYSEDSGAIIYVQKQKRCFDGYKILNYTLLACVVCIILVFPMIPRFCTKGRESTQSRKFRYNSYDIIRVPS